MAFLASQLIRANAHCPRPTFIEDGSPRFGYHYYNAHSSGLCHLVVWRPSTNFQGAPVAVFVNKRELGAAYGWGEITTELFVSTPKMGALAEALSARGWVIVSVELPITSKNVHQRLPGGAAGATKILGSWWEKHPVAMWPEQPRLLASALQYLKTNYSAIADSSLTTYGPELWGDGNSISRSQIVVVGNEWGAQIALFAGLQPTGNYGFTRDLSHDSMDPLDPVESHRVRGIVALNPGPIDFTQFYVGRDPLQAKYYYPNTQTAGVGNQWDEPPGTPSYLKADRFHPFTRAESFRRWSKVSMRFKRASPWWLMRPGAEVNSENANLSLFIEFEGQGYDTGGGGWDANLGPNDFREGTVRSDSAGGRAWIQPNDGRVQGQAVREALWSYGGADPTLGDLPIRHSVVNDTAPNTLYPVTSSLTFAASVIEWMQEALALSA